MKYVILALFFMISNIAHAQSEAPDAYVACREGLIALPYGDLIAMSEAGTYGEIEETLEDILLGEKCSVIQIIGSLEDLGWKNDARRARSINPTFSNQDFSADYVIHFCLPERGLWRLVSDCRGGATFYFFQGRVTWIAFAAPLRFG